MIQTRPSGKLPFVCQKIAQKLQFKTKKKLPKNVHANGIFNGMFWAIFDIQMAIFRSVRFNPVIRTHL